jgi:hypothetical protein
VTDRLKKNRIESLPSSLLLYTTKPSKHLLKINNSCLEESKYMKKNIWKKPQLVILERSKPEEAILAGCKNPGYRGGGPGRSNCKIPGRGHMSCRDLNPS